MKKFTLLLPLLFLSGCSLINNQPTVPETVTIPQQEISGVVPTTQTIGQITGSETLPTSNPVLSTTSSVFDSSKIVLEGAEVSFEGYYRYKDILNFKNGSIGVQMGGQDGYEIELIYTENGKVIKTSSPIFWYDRRYTDKRINEYCLNQPGFQGLDKCTLVKVIECIPDKKQVENSDCGNKVIEYMYNLIQGNESNGYFSQNFQNFKNSL